MFGINVNDVIRGHYNEITNRENELYERRIRICRECPLFGHNVLGDVCDASKCWDIINNKPAFAPGKGIACGCGCRLNSKLRLPNAQCVLNKW